MDYCSIDQAFPAIGPPTERTNKKKKKQGLTSGPPEPVSLDKDPDREQYVKKEIPPKEKSSEEPFTAVIAGDGGIVSRFFGEAEEDDFAPYTGAKDDFMLQPDFKKIFEEKGFSKAAGVSIRPAPADSFATIDSAFQNVAFKTPKIPYKTADSESYDLKKQLDSLRSRLDDLERYKRGNSENTQGEITLFVMSGLAFIFVMDMMSRF
jgi:hypothetical protein